MQFQSITFTLQFGTYLESQIFKKFAILDKSQTASSTLFRLHLSNFVERFLLTILNICSINLNILKFLLNQINLRQDKKKSVLGKFYPKKNQKKKNSK